MPKSAAKTDQNEPAEAEAMAQVQAELPERYGIALGVLAATKRRHKRLLLQDALDLLFAQHGVNVTNSANPAGSTLKGA